MMLFLFVIMLVGVEASDSRVETIKGQRVAAILAGLGFGGLLVAVVARAAIPDEPAGLAAAPEGNVPAIADLIFTRYIFAFEITSALLITAAVGAMVLAFQERFTPRLNQRERAQQRARSGDLADLAPLPAPGVYARHNAVDTPALLPDGRPARTSLSRVLVARDSILAVPETAADVARNTGEPEAPQPGDEVLAEPPPPDASRPDASRPETSRPDTSRSDASRPDASRPDAVGQQP
jgi:NADH-quinone oxidoreductase subunit J